MSFGLRQVELRTSVPLLGHDLALGTGPVTGNGGAIAADGGARTIANSLNGNVVVDGVFDLTLDSSRHGQIIKNGGGTLIFAKAGTVTD